jgi:photosystem II stability/assembly factor-like uncharacterized protein
LSSAKSEKLFALAATSLFLQREGNMTCTVKVLRRLHFVIGLVILATFALVLKAEEPLPNKGGPPEFKTIRYRLVGPAVGGRVSRSAGVPGDPLTYYLASASGGVWKSSDGGISWKPIFDEQPISSIGSLALAPSDPNVIYVGSGEANIRGNVAPGNGIYKSTDAGKTWKHVWKQEGQIGTMIVHPTNPDIAYAAVLGHAFGPNPERGVYRTTDGGKTWQRILHKDADTGASDICLDPTNPRILLAGLWQTRRRPWELTSGGSGSGLYQSKDGGDTWKQLTGKAPPHPALSPDSGGEGEVLGKGLPDGPWGKIGVAFAPSDTRRVYALIEADKGGLFRSDDGGDTWKLVNGKRYLRQRAWYYSTLTIDPRNADVIWCPQVNMLKSIDGGKTFQRIRGLHHGDNHDLWIDPQNPKRLIASNDGGVDLSTNGGESWHAPPLPLAQFYHVAADNDMPYHVSGAMQDIGTAAGPSNSLSASGITNGDWHEVGGGEAGFTAHDPNDPNVVYAGEYGGYISRYDHRSRQSRNVSAYPVNPSGHGAEDLRYRFQWTAPILVSPHDPKVIYHGSNVLFKTRDGGMHWERISPDLTRNDKSKQKWSGGPITGDNTGVEVYCTIFAVAESPKQKDVLWTGSDDGVVQVTRDGGKNWTDVTRNIPGMPEWGTVAAIEASPFEVATAYVVVDAHRVDDPRPYLFKTTDYGRTWHTLSANLPQDTHLHAVREDPKCKGLLYAGTERGVAYSKDNGATWRQLKLNFPTVAVHDLVVKNDDLVVGTHGRSIWILDNLNPIREMSPQIADADTYLFPVPAARGYRYHSPSPEKSIGQNPPAGVVVDYYLKKKPKGTISLEVRDVQGTLVHTFRSKPDAKGATYSSSADKNVPAGKREAQPPATSIMAAEAEDEPEDDPDNPGDRIKKTVLTTEAGVNRVAWDLRYKGAEKIKGAKVDMGRPEVGPFALPGVYTLKLMVEGKTFTREVVVQPDPRVQVSAADQTEQLRMALAIRDDLSRITRMVNQIRSLKKQLSARSELVKGDPKLQELIKPGAELTKKLDALEERLHNPKAEVTYDILAQRGGAKLYSQLAALFEFVKGGDGAPTQGVHEVYAEQAQELNRCVAEFNSLVSGELAKLNETAMKLSVPNIIVSGAQEARKSP